MTLTIEWRHRIQNWQKVINKLVVKPIQSLDLEGFTTTEQLTLSEAITREFHAMPRGTRWGKKWEYAWYRGSLVIPDEAKGKHLVLCLAPGGESLVWINGKIVGSVDREHTVITLANPSIPGDTYLIVVEAYAGHGRIYTGEDGPVPNGWETVPEPGTTQAVVGSSYLGIWEEQLYQLGLDMQTLIELRDGLDDRSLRVAEIDRALMDATLLVDLELPYAAMMKTVEAGRERLSPVLACQNGNTMPTFYAVGHAHLDVAWLWPLQETERKMGRTIANQLSLMEEYPEYVYIQSQAHLYTMLKKRYPELYERLQEKVKAGQIVPEGGAWVEPDTNLTSGESLIRQFIYGKKFFKDEFGVDCILFWEPDVFGYSGALPQIMLGCGMKYFATQKILWTYNGADPFPYNLFMWEGIDGSQVLAQVYLGYGNETSPAHLIKNWNERVQTMGTSTSLYGFGWGDGGGGATRDHLEYLRRVRDLEGAPRVQITSPLKFFEDVERRGLPKERYVGELYYQAHRGTYTSQARTKRNNRKSEWALREVEFWGSIGCKVNQYEYPFQAVRDAWEKLLLHQFHDILPGSSIARVYEEADQVYQDVLTNMEHALNQSLASYCTPGKSITVFNSLNWSRKALVPMPEGVNGGVDLQGKRLLGQRIDDTTYLEVSLPACGWTTIQQADADEQDVIPIATSANTLENEYMKVVFNEYGEITSLYDKVSNQEFMAGNGNLFELYKDVPTNFDAWDIDSMTSQVPVPTGRQQAKMSVISAGSLVGIIRLEIKLGQSQVTQEISLSKGSRRLEFKTTVDWQERHKLLKVGFPTTIHTNEAIHEIQFGHIRRPNHTSRPFDADRFEVSNHKWSALAEEKRGFAVLNDCKYGLNVLGNSIHLTLLKSAMAPDMNADRGVHNFTYAVFIWNGSFADCAVVEEAYELNCPLSLINGDGDEGSVFSVSPSNIIIETVKPAEDGSGDLIVRLYESKRTATRCRLKISLPLGKVFQTNMLEEIESEIAVHNQTVSLNFRAFEIKTLRLVIL